MRYLKALVQRGSELIDGSDLSRGPNLMKFLPLFLLPLVHGTVCTAPMDLVFLLDSSASVRSSDFEIAKTFVKTIAGRYEMSDRAVHISLVNFANWAATIWDFADDASSSFEKLTAKIDAMPARGAEGNGNTCVAEGSSCMPSALPLTACLHTHTHTLSLYLSALTDRHGHGGAKNRRSERPGLANARSGWRQGRSVDGYHRHYGRQARLLEALVRQVLSVRVPPW